MTNRLILAALFAHQILGVVCSVVQFAVFLHVPMGECVYQLAQLSQVTEDLPTLISATVRFPSKGSEGTKKHTENSDLESSLKVQEANKLKLRLSTDCNLSTIILVLALVAAVTIPVLT